MYPQKRRCRNGPPGSLASAKGLLQIKVKIDQLGLSLRVKLSCTSRKDGNQIGVSDVPPFELGARCLSTIQRGKNNGRGGDEGRESQRTWTPRTW